MNDICNSVRLIISYRQVRCWLISRSRLLAKFDIDFVIRFRQMGISVTIVRQGFSGKLRTRRCHRCFIGKLLRETQILIMTN